MTYIITEACIGEKDKSCVAVCPVDCIYESLSMLVIEPSECIDCGACVPECPVDAIYPDDLLPSEMSGFVEINAVWLEGGADAVEEKLRALRTPKGNT
jgi:ferredoxin